MIDAENRIHMDEPTRFVAAPDLVPNALYESPLLPQADRAGDQRHGDRPGDGRAGRPFHARRAGATLQNVLRHNRARQREFEPIAHTMVMLAKANYEIRFDPGLDVSERIIFPSSPDRDQRDRGRSVRPVHP